jgi:molybdopterin converting factor small subunit
LQHTTQFFSQLREIVGHGEISIEMPEGATVGDLLAQLYRRFPGLEKWDANLLLGIGVDFVDREQVLQPNDQVALMPPVQGG